MNAESILKRKLQQGGNWSFSSIDLNADFLRELTPKISSVDKIIKIRLLLALAALDSSQFAMLGEPINSIIKEICSQEIEEGREREWLFVLSGIIRQQRNLEASDAPTSAYPSRHNSAGQVKDLLQLVADRFAQYPIALESSKKRSISEVVGTHIMPAEFIYLSSSFLTDSEEAGITKAEGTDKLSAPNFISRYKSKEEENRASRPQAKVQLSSSHSSFGTGTAMPNIPPISGLGNLSFLGASSSCISGNRSKPIVKAADFDMVQQSLAAEAAAKKRKTK